MKLNIRHKLVGFACSLVVFVGVGVGLYAFTESREQFMAGFEQQSQGMAQVVASSLAQEMNAPNVANLQSRLKVLLDHPNVSYVYVFDSGGELLFAADKREKAKGGDKGSHFSSAATSGGWKSTVEENSLRVDGPIMVESATLGGFLSIGFSTAALDEALREVIEESVFVTLFFLLCGCFAAFFLARRFSGPIIAIRKVASAIKSGNLAARVGSDSTDELGQLGESINSMAAAIESGQQATQAAEEELHRGLNDMRVLQEVGQLILEARDSNEVFEPILQKTLLACGFDLGTILLPESSASALRVAAACGYRDPNNILRQANRTESYGVRIVDAPLVLDSIQDKPGLRTLKKEGISCALFVPIQSGGEIIGFLQLGSRAVREIRPGEIRLAESLGRQIGIAIQKAKLADAGQRHLARMEALHQITAAATSSLRLDEILDLVLKRIESYLPFSALSTIRLVNQNTGELELEASHDLFGEDHGPLFVGEKKAAFARRSSIVSKPC